MAAVAHDPQFARKVGVPVAVGQDFARADKAKQLARILSSNNSGKL